MPNRLLKESICTSDNIDRLSAFHETMFYRLMVNCDDYGRMDARHKILSAKLFPLKDISAAKIEDGLKAMMAADLVLLYEVDGKPFLQMKTWERHQQIRAKKSRYPGPESARGQMISNDIKCDQMISDDIKCSRNPIQYESNTNPKREKQTRFSPPTLDEVRAYCAERGGKVDAERFMDFYTSKGWKVGSQPMKDWKAAVRTWEQRDSAQPQRTPVRVLPAQSYSQREYDGDTMSRLQDEALREARALHA